MKYLIEWWGVILIPETDFDVDDLERLQTKLEGNLLPGGGYEVGTVVWHDKDELQLQNGSTTTPLGALIINR